MDRVKLERLYKERGLLDFQLQSLDDVFFIHGINASHVEGYGKLSNEEKKIFKAFIISYLNSMKLEDREGSFLKVSHEVKEFLKVVVIERGKEFVVFVKGI